MFFLRKKQINTTIPMSGNLIISKASAGSGKTFKLVKTFIEMSFDVNKEDELKYRFKQILAITFTNKATSEMKSRILTYLHEIMNDATKSAMSQSIANEDNDNRFGTTLTDKYNTLQRYARIVHKAILHNYSDLSVCTIDSFVNRVVQTFAHDLNLPLNFNVTLDNDDVTQHIVDNLMATVGDNPDSDLAKMLEEFVNTKMEDDKSANIENDIKEQCKNLYDETITEYLSSLNTLNYNQAKVINRELLKANEEDKKEIYTLGKGVYDACIKLSDNVKDYYQGERGLYGLLKKIINRKDIADLKINNYCKNFHNSKALINNEILHKKIGDLLTLIESKRVIIATRNNIRRYIFTVALLKELNTKAQEYYLEEGTLHISEFNKKVNEAIKNEPAPFIYERIGNRYRNFLIDEFQDTSIMQWQNLLPLVDNSVSGGNSSLIVGDAKQAIYRFRQGDAKQFIDLPKVDSDMHGKIFQTCHTFEPLDTNFRTCKNIVEFNNHLFEWIAIGEGVDINKIYVGDNADTPELRQKSIKEGGYAEVSFVAKDEENKKLYQNILNIIQQQVNVHGYSYNDICILARKNKELSAIGTYLSQKGIPVISNESFLLSNSSTILTLISLLRHIAKPLDQNIAKQLLVALQSIGKTPTLSTEIIDNAVNPAKLLKQYAGIDLNTEYMSGLSLYDCCEEVVRELHLADHDQIYISTFLNIVASYSQFHKNDLAEFLEWYNKKAEKLSAKNASKQNAVELMTVHKSKGLEARIVIYAIYPDKKHSTPLWVKINEEQRKKLNDSNLPPIIHISQSKDNPTIFNEDFAIEETNEKIDNLNVFYVAMTRPKDKIFVLVETTEKGTISSLSGGYLQQFRDKWGAISLNGDNTQNYHVGENQTKISVDTSQDDTIPLNTISYDGWSERLVIAPESQKTIDSISANIDYGNKVHSILSTIKTSADIGQAIKDYITEASKNGTVEDAQPLDKAVRNVVEHPDCNKFFAPNAEVKTECDILYNGELRRPDRIVITDADTYVVDFKTGKPNDSHKQQVAEYCNAITEMGYQNVSGHLIYIGDTISVEKV